MALLSECIVLQKSITNNIHVYYQDNKAIIDINRVELTEGNYLKKLRVYWLGRTLEKEESLVIGLSQMVRYLFKIDPLRIGLTTVLGLKLLHH